MNARWFKSAILAGALAASDPAWAADDSKPPLTFTFADPTASETQTLRVRLLPKRRASFDFQWRTARCSGHVSGVAKLSVGDLESDDEDGEGYFVDEFISAEKGECWVSVRIEMDTRRRATVLIADCPQSCPRSEKRILKRAEPANSNAGHLAREVEGRFRK